MQPKTGEATEIQNFTTLESFKIIGRRLFFIANAL